MNIVANRNTVRNVLKILRKYEKYYDNEKKDDEDKGDPNKAECIVAKNRHGEIKTVELYWDGQYTRFASQDVYR